MYGEDLQVAYLLCWLEGPVGSQGMRDRSGDWDKRMSGEKKV